MVEMVPIVNKWMLRYIDKPQGLEEYLKNSCVAREIGRSVYQFFVNSKQLMRIEDFEEKGRIWETAKSWVKLEKKEAIKLAKTLYMFEALLQRKIS